MQAKRASTAKKPAGSKAVDDYLARLPEAARSRLERLRAIIRSAVPREAEECISYGMPGFRYCGALVCYGAFKDHYSLFPMNAQLIADLRDELKAYKTAKGTIQFPLENPPPAALVKKIVKLRAAQNLERSGR
ncbi:MAG: DUF1801 domain-containing protein [Terracidiphilus sp.]|jgi:uncharacterized protein YdhG (YjbR/CyaY superfamily)